MFTRFRIAAILLLAFIFRTALIAQPFPVTITIAVAPPYYPHINDYIEQPNKIMATLINTGPAAVSIYLLGSVTGETGIRVYTDPVYRMPVPIVIQPQGMYFVSRNNLEQIFSVDNLKYEGISKNQLIYGNGLPEGEYQICLRAYDYNQRVPLSPEDPAGCSAPFNVTSVEPPVILQPLTGTDITPSTPQQVVFSWTRPPNAPANTKFNLKIIEVLPYDRNINDAMQSATHPVFFEKEMMVNTYLYGPVDPALVEGKKYAFAVVAFDPDNKTVFRNNGMSEVFSFNYKSELKIDTGLIIGVDHTIPGLGLLEEQFELIPATTITGKILAKYPNNPGEPLTVEGHGPGTVEVVYPKANPPAGLGGYTYGQIVNGSLEVMGNVINNNNGYWNPFGSNNGAPESLNSYGMPMLGPMNSKKFIFAQTENTNFTKPLPNTRVKLVARLAVLNLGTFGVDFPTEYGGGYPITNALDLDGKYRTDGMSYVNVVLATAVTDEEGNFTFDFQAPFFTGPFIGGTLEHGPENTLPINPFDEIHEVFPGCGGGYNTNPGYLQNVAPGFMNGTGNTVPGFQGGNQGGNQGGQQVMSLQINKDGVGGYLCLKLEVDDPVFCSPDIDIFTMPGATLNLPVQVARLKTFDLTIDIKSSDKKNQLNGAGQPLAGVNVRIYRDTSTLRYFMPLILDYEGQKLQTRTFNNDGAFKDISASKTDVDGKVYFRNLVRRNPALPAYIVSLKTRETSTAETYYDFTFYNYEDIFTELETNSSTNAVMKPFPKVVYNHEYTSPTQAALTYVMNPLDPEIKGRVMVASNLENTGMKDVSVDLLNQSSSSKFSSYMAFLNGCYGVGHQEGYTQTNASGFFRFYSLKVNEDANGKINGPYRRIYISYPGYKKVIMPPISEFPYNLAYGQLKDIKDVNLEAEQMLLGYVQDEDGQAVASYVKSTYSPYFKTIKSFKTSPGGNGMMQYTVQENFSVPTEHNGTKLTVNPLSSQYFSRDTVISNPTENIRVTVYKRLHRPMIIVKNQQGQLIQGAIVDISGNISFTDSKGTARFRFAAADDQFVIRIVPGDGYCQVQEGINIPVSTAYKVFTYFVKKAKSISGYITNKNDATAISGAVVYSELKQTDGIPLYISATSDAQGFYQLKGIPTGLTHLVVHVVKEGSNPYFAGVVQDLDLTLVVQVGKKLYYNFALTPVDGWVLSDIWGFPVTIESFTPNTVQAGQPPTAKISGYFHNPPPVNGFTLLKADQKLPFKNLQVVRNAQNKAEPTGSMISMDVLDIPVTIRNTFTGHLNYLVKTGPGYNIMTGMPNIMKYNLALSKAGLPQDAAGISGQVEMNLNSFKIANDFHGVMFMGDDTLSAKTIVFANKAIPGTGDKHYIFSLGMSMQPVPVAGYRVFNFNADADLGRSVLEGTQVRLRTILHTEIPGCPTCQPLDLKVRAGDLVISGNEISFVASPSEKLNFELEKWKVYSQKDWYWDKNEESIVLPEVLIVTPQGIDAKVVNMKIRPKSLSEGTISLSGGLTLGGIADLVLSGTLKPLFNYDQGIGHYRISLVGQTNQPAATVSGLPNTVPSTLEFKSIGMLSNDETVMTIGQGYRFFNIIDMYVDQIMSGPGFFKLNGQPDPGIPYFSGVSANMSYFKSGNKLASKMEPIKGFIECAGGVEFLLDEPPEAQSVKPGIFTSYGTITIKPAPGETGNPIHLRGLLTKTNDSCNISIIKVDNQKLYAGQNPQLMVVGANTIRVVSGRAAAVNNAWTNLKYRGNTSGIDGLNDPNANNLLDFEVKGAIDINSSNVSVTNIQSPLGSMSMVFNFDEPSFTGTLTINNLNMGFAAINYGMMGIRFDPKGYYLCFVGDINLSAYGQYAGGFIVGNTSHVLTEHSGPLLGNFYTGYRPGFANGGPIKGFYAIGERIIVDKSFNLVVTVAAKAGLGAYVTADFSNEPTIIIGGYGYAKFTAGVDIGLCCFCMCTGAMFDIHGGIENGQWMISNCATNSINVTMCVKTLSADFKMDVTYKNGLNIDVGLGSCGGGSVPGPCD